MRHRLERNLGKRGQWVLVPVTIAIAIWAGLSIVDNPVAQVISKLAAGGVLIVPILLLLEARQKLWSLTSQTRTLERRIELIRRNSSPETMPPVESDFDRKVIKDEMEKMVGKLHNEIRTGFRSLSHNKSTDEAVLRLEAYARHVIAATTVAAVKPSNELRADRSASTEEEV